MIANWFERDQDVVAEHFELDPLNDINWLSYSPLLYHFVQQLSRKIDFVVGHLPDKVTFVPHGNEDHKLFAYQRTHTNTGP